MVNSIIKSKWMWLTLITSLVVLILMAFYCIYQIHVSNDYWKHQFLVANTQYVVRFKQQKIVLNEQMQKWLKENNVRQNKYYRAVIKGYGSHIQFLSGNGLGTPSVKHFFVNDKQVSIQGDILILPQGRFCGNWQLINITPEQYIFYLYKNNN